MNSAFVTSTINQNNVNDGSSNSAYIGVSDSGGITSTVNQDGSMNTGNIVVTNSGGVGASIDQNGDMNSAGINAHDAYSLVHLLIETR